MSIEPAVVPLNVAPPPPPPASMTPSSVNSSAPSSSQSMNGPIPGHPSPRHAVNPSNPLPPPVPSTAVGDRTFAEYLHDHFDLVYRRLTMGRRDLKTVKAYLESRGAAEKAYADKVTKDAHAATDLSDSSSAIAVWKEVKESAAAVSSHHQAVASLCAELVAALDKTIKEIKGTKTSLQTRYNRLTEDCKTKQAKHDKARDAYSEAVKHCEQSIQARDNGRQLPPPKQQQLENAVSRSLTLLNQKHEEYKRTVGVLKEAQVHYDAQMVEMMAVMEKTEAERLRALNECLQRFAAQHDQLSQADASIAASLHRSVATIDNRRDLQDFIALTTTNTKPRPHVEYHPISSAIIDQNAGRPAMLKSGPPALPVGNGSVQQLPIPSSAYPGQQQTVISSSASIPVVLTTGSSAPGQTAPYPPGAVKFIPPPVTEKFVPPPAPSAGEGYAVALYDFDSAEPEDLTFKVGDVISLKQAEESEDWWTGQLRGRVGIFPKTYVKKQTAVDANNSRANTADHVQPPGYAATSSVSTSAAVGVVPAPSVPSSSASSGPVNFSSAPAAQPADNPAAAASPEQPREMDAKCEALFDFVGQDVDELSFSKGDQLTITGELNGWYLGKIEGTNQVGIFPSNYVHVYQ